MKGIPFGFNIEYVQKVLKQLKKLNKSIASEVFNCIEQYSATPMPTKTQKLKTSFDGAYRLRYSDY